MEENTQTCSGWVSISESKPPHCRSGISIEVLITARLRSSYIGGENVVVKIDKYDEIAGSWLDHDNDTWDVTAWKLLIPFQPNN